MYHFHLHKLLQLEQSMDAKKKEILQNLKAKESVHTEIDLINFKQLEISFSPSALSKP